MACSVYSSLSDNAIIGAIKQASTVSSYPQQFQKNIFTRWLYGQIQSEATIHPHHNGGLIWL